MTADRYGVETVKFDVLLRRSNQLHLREKQRYYGYYQEVMNCIPEMNYETVNLAYNRSAESGNKFNFKSIYNEVELFFSRQMYTWNRKKEDPRLTLTAFGFSDVINDAQSIDASIQAL